jgi:hypothetical protein
MSWCKALPRLVRGLLVAMVCGVGLVVYADVLDRAYPIRQWLIWQLLPLWGYTLLWSAACVAGGSSVLRWLLGGRNLPAIERLLLSMAVGAVLFVFVWNVGGAFCLFRTWMSVALPVALLGAGAYGVPELWRELSWWRRERRLSSLSRRTATALAVGWGLVCVAFLYIEALPLDAINYDASWYHMTTAQDYARAGCIIPLPGEDHKAYPHLTSLVQTWAFLVPGLEPLPLRWMLALHLEFSIVLWRIVGVAAAAHWMLGEKDTPGLWPVFFLFPSIFVYDQAIGGSADHFLGFFAAPMFLATARALPDFDWRMGTVLGIVSAGHMLTKYQSVYLVVAVAVVFAARWLYLVGRRSVLAMRRRSLEASAPPWRAMLMGPLSVIVAAAVFSSPHFIKNTAFYGNPIYPMGLDVFETSHPVHPAGPYTVYESRSGPFAPKHSGDLVKRQLWIARLLYTYSFQSHNRNFTDHRPYMGALFSLLLPCALFVYRPRRLWLGIAFGAVAFAVWANLSVNDRYLLSFCDVFIAVAAALMVRVWQVGWLGRMAVVPVVALQLVWGGDAMLFYGAKSLRQAMGLIADGYAGRYASRIAKNNKLQNITDATPPDAVILSRNYRGLLGLDRLVLSDIYEGQSYISYSGIRDSRELWELYRSRGVTHLLYPENQRQPRRWNNTLLFDDLAYRYGKNRRTFSNLVLVELPSKAPPPSAPFWVLSSGNRAYPDGLYRVEQLDVDDWNYRRSAPKPEPATPLTRANVGALLRKAEAVAVDRSLPGVGPEELRRDFVLFERFGSTAVYLRKKKGPREEAP